MGERVELGEIITEGYRRDGMLVGVTKREVGMARREVGMAKREVGMARRDVGMARREVGVVMVQMELVRLGVSWLLGQLGA